MTTAYKNEHVKCDIHILPDGTVHVIGSVIDPSNYSRMEVYAANPIDRMINYAGSGLPFPSAEMAFDNSPNYLGIQASGTFEATFSYPNSFNTADALTKVPPSVFIRITPIRTTQAPIHVRFELPDPLPLRTLGYRPSRSIGPHYYAAKEVMIPIAGAEATMRNYADAKSRFDIA